MSRALAILLLVCLIASLLATGMTERVFEASSLYEIVSSAALRLVTYLGIFFYCGFAALHSMQHIESPHRRTEWLLLTIVMNVFGSCWYYCSIYQDFRKKGQGGLLRGE